MPVAQMNWMFNCNQIFIEQMYISLSNSLVYCSCELCMYV